MAQQEGAEGRPLAEGFPREGMELTQVLVVSNLDRSRAFYRDVLGVTVVREYGGTSCVLTFLGSWLLLVTGGGPTKDKPTVTFAPPVDVDSVSHEMTIRVPDCQAAYQVLQSRRARFLSPPVDWGGEIRCFFRDPDGHLPPPVSHPDASPLRALMRRATPPPRHQIGGRTASLPALTRRLWLTWLGP